VATSVTVTPSGTRSRSTPVLATGAPATSRVSSSRSGANGSAGGAGSPAGRIDQISPIASTPVYVPTTGASRATSTWPSRSAVKAAHDSYAPWVARIVAVPECRPVALMTSGVSRLARAGQAVSAITPRP
jgi:hypothetical protein